MLVFKILSFVDKIGTSVATDREFLELLINSSLLKINLNLTKYEKQFT
jgi:hypothetical protein